MRRYHRSGNFRWHKFSSNFHQIFVLFNFCHSSTLMKFKRMENFFPWPLSSDPILSSPSKAPVMPEMQEAIYHMNWGLSLRYSAISTSHLAPISVFWSCLWLRVLLCCCPHRLTPSQRNDVLYVLEYYFFFGWPMIRWLNCTSAECP